MRNDGYNAYDSSSFSRTVANEKKMGAYYTEVDHCRDVGKMFIWPENDEVCVLEPSIGDASAVIACTGADGNENVKIFGVELNDETCEETKKNPFVHCLVKADFLDGFTSRREVFSFCFANPPYLNQVSDYGSGRQRSEREFLDKIGDYLRKGAVLVWVVPQNVFFEPSHVRTWIRDYEMLTIFKFRGKEFEKFHQIVAVGRRRRHGFVRSDEVADFVARWRDGGIPELPDDLTPSIRVMPSSVKSVDLFTTKTFDSSLALTWLNERGLGEEMGEAFERGVTEEKYLPRKLGRPPIPLKKDSEYLLLTSGFTDGLVGDEAEGNLHMMRGVANVVDHKRISTSMDEETGEEKSSKLIVTSSTEIEVRIIEQNGNIRLLGGKEEASEGAEN